MAMEDALTFACGFSLRNEETTTKGEAQVQLENEKLTLLPNFGEALHLSFVDIVEIFPADYRVEMTLSSGDKLDVFDLGYKFGDFVSNLFHLRNEIILKYLLMSEAIKKAGIWGDVAFVDESGKERLFESCELRLYETSVVFIPTVGEPIRVHFSDIAQVEGKDYALAISTESMGRLAVSKLGRELDSTSSALSEAINARTVQVQSLIRDLISLPDPSVVRNVARMMKEGQAAKRADLESISPEIWSALERQLAKTSIWNSYQYLKTVGRQEKIAMGLKRGLMGDLTGNYIWTLIPIYGSKSGTGNAIAIEAVRIALDSSENGFPASGAGSEESTSGNATYFFRIVARRGYAEMSAKELDTKVDGIISKLNRLMLDINFRREPIYLPDDLIRNEPKYARYKYAAHKIPSLRDLRQLFIGRVIHSSFEHWKTDVSDLLSFNMTSDDGEKWKK